MGGPMNGSRVACHVVCGKDVGWIGAMTTGLSRWTARPSACASSRSTSSRPSAGDHDALTVRCRAPLVGYRKVRNSGGVQDERAVIATKVAIGEQLRTIELTLAPRTNMRFRMLLGRSGILDGYHVIPRKSYLLGGFKGAHEFGEEEE